MFNKIRNWAQERNLVAGSTSQAQMVKLVEEIGELAGGIAKKKDDVVKDSIADAIVVLTIIAAQHDLDMNDCIQAAYDEIKDRKGKMIDGVFVKEADLPQENISTAQPPEKTIQMEKPLNTKQTWRSVLSGFGLNGCYTYKPMPHDFKYDVCVTITRDKVDEFSTPTLLGKLLHELADSGAENIKHIIKLDSSVEINFRARSIK